jgi:hypothetical protein
VLPLDWEYWGFRALGSAGLWACRPRELALESGITNWRRVPALNTNPTFINDLADAVMEVVSHAQPINQGTVYDALVPPGTMGLSLSVRPSDHLPVPPPAGMPACCSSVHPSIRLAVYQVGLSGPALAAVRWSIGDLSVYQVDLTGPTLAAARWSIGQLSGPACHFLRRPRRRRPLADILHMTLG